MRVFFIWTSSFSSSYVIKDPNCSNTCASPTLPCSPVRSEVGTAGEIDLKKERGWPLSISSSLHELLQIDDILSTRGTRRGGGDTNQEGICPLSRPANIRASALWSSLGESVTRKVFIQHSKMGGRKGKKKSSFCHPHLCF